MTSSTLDRAGVVDPRTAAALPDASPEVADLWARAGSVACGDLPVMGLAAGDRPTADVEVLAGAFAAVEYELARRMHAASTAGAVPLAGPGAVLTARGWATPQARRLARAGALAADHPTIATAWAGGLITAEHVDAVARHADTFTTEELAAVLRELTDHWGRWSPAAIARFVAAAARMLHPPPGPDPGRDETDAHACRDLSFAVLGDTVVLSGALPRLEGEAVIAAIDALAEKLRSTADHVPAGARRADALVELVNTAAATGTLPTRGGLPIALTVTLAHTTTGDPIWTTSRGHHLTPAETQFVACDPTLTPILLTPTTSGGGGTGTGGGGPGFNPAPDEPHTADANPWRAHPDHPRQEPGPGHPPGPANPVPANPVPADPVPAGPATPSHPGPPRPRAQPTPADRITALAALLLGGPRHPLAVGRTSRTATPAQRKALATRDHGCIIPGCQIPAENCQAHHLTDWADTGNTDIDNLALLCWTHHRQVDLRMWTIHPTPDGHQQPRTPPPPRSTTRHHLARQQRRTIHHHPHTTPPLAPVTDGIGTARAKVRTAQTGPRDGRSCATTRCRTGGRATGSAGPGPRSPAARARRSW